MTPSVQVPLGELAEFVMGQAPPSAACNTAGEGVPFVKAGEFSARRPVVREWTTKPLKLARAGDVLVCVVGATAGKINQGIDCAIGRSVAAIRPRSDRLSSEYLYWFLSTRVGNLRRGSQGIAQGVITRDMLAEVRVPLPPIDEQRRIVTILDQADALRATRRRARTCMEELVASLLTEALGADDFGFASIADVADVRSGLQVTSRRQSLPIEVPYLRVANVFRGRLDLSEIKTMRVTEPELSRARVRTGDVLVVEGHGNRDEVGRAAVWQGGLDNCVHQNHLIRVTFDARSIKPEFGAAWLNSLLGRQHLLRSAKTTSGLNTISTSNVKQSPIPLLPLPRQERFARRLQEARGLSARFDRTEDHLDLLVTSLQQRALAGSL